MANPLKDKIEEAKDLLEDAVDAENAKPPNVSGSQVASEDAIDGKVNDIIISSNPPNLNPFDAGQTVAAIFYSDRIEFLEALRDLAAGAFDEANNGNDQEVIGEKLWTIWNSKAGLYSLYP